MLLIFLNIFFTTSSLSYTGKFPFVLGNLIGNTVSVVFTLLMFVLARRAKVLNHVSRYLIYHLLADNRILMSALPFIHDNAIFTQEQM